MGDRVPGVRFPGSLGRLPAYNLFLFTLLGGEVQPLLFPGVCAPIPAYTDLGLSRSNYTLCWASQGAFFSQHLIKYKSLPLTAWCLHGCMSSALCFPSEALSTSCPKAHAAPPSTSNESLQLLTREASLPAGLSLFGDTLSSPASYTHFLSLSFPSVCPTVHIHFCLLFIIALTGQGQSLSYRDQSPGEG